MNKKLEQIAKFAYSNKETVLHTYNTAKKLIKDGIEGYFVECGVGAGAQLAAMMLAQKDTGGADFMVFGFDSFEGIPMAGPNDTEQPGIGEIKHNVNLPERERLISSGITVHSKENVLNNIRSVGLETNWLTLVKGWFQDTIQSYTHKGISKISLLRLDGDLYESTFCCLQHLYPLVAYGGVVIIDDWGLEGARKAVCDYFENNLPDMKIVEGSGTVAYFVKGVYEDKYNPLARN